MKEEPSTMTSPQKPGGGSRVQDHGFGAWDYCHGCKRDLPDGVMRLIVHSTAFRGMRQWCEDCQQKGWHRR
jgi:hypothetical protein